jgi:hypothetical protein
MKTEDLAAAVERLKQAQANRSDAEKEADRAAREKREELWAESVKEELKSALGEPKQAKATRIPWEAVCLIRELWETGRFTKADLGRRFNITPRHIKSIVDYEQRKQEFPINNESIWSYL